MSSMGDARTAAWGTATEVQPVLRRKYTSIVKMSTASVVQQHFGVVRRTARPVADRPLITMFWVFPRLVVAVNLPGIDATERSLVDREPQASSSTTNPRATTCCDAPPSGTT
jgi:hypothetical protein